MADEKPKSVFSSRWRPWLGPAVLIALIALVFTAVDAIIDFRVGIENRLSKLETIFTILEKQLTLIEMGEKTVLPVTQIDPRDIGATEELAPLLVYLPRNLNARWGKGHEMRDVTATVISLCGGNNPCTVSVGAIDLGLDPFPGIPKDLIVEYQCKGRLESQIYTIIDSTELFISCL